MERPRPVTPEEQEALAQKRRAFDQRLDEIRVDNLLRSEEATREQGSAVIRIAAQGD